MAIVKHREKTIQFDTDDVVRFIQHILDNDPEYHLGSDIFDCSLEEFSGGVYFDPNSETFCINVTSDDK